MRVISNFISAIQAPINKGTVESALHANINEIDDVIGYYNLALNLTELGTLHNNTNINLNKEFYKWYNLTSRDDKLVPRPALFKDVITLLKNVKANGPELEHQLRDVKSKVISTNAIAINTANVLRSVPHYAFIVDYGTRLINFIITTECDQVGKNTLNNIPEGEAKYLAKHMRVFSELLSVYGMKPKEFKAKLIGLSTAILTKENESLIENSPEGDTELVDGGLVNQFLGNPLYFFGTMWNTWLDDRYKKMSSAKRLIELRLLHYERLKAGGNLDPETMEEIEFLQNKINSLTVKMNKINPEKDHMRD